MVLVTYKKSQHSKPKYNSLEPKYCNYHYKIIILTTNATPTTTIIIMGTASLSFQYDRKIRQRQLQQSRDHVLTVEGERPAGCSFFTHATTHWELIVSNLHMVIQKMIGSPWEEGGLYVAKNVQIIWRSRLLRFSNWGTTVLFQIGNLEVTSVKYHNPKRTKRESYQEDLRQF